MTAEVLIYNDTNSDKTVCAIDFGGDKLAQLLTLRLYFQVQQPQVRLLDWLNSIFKMVEFDMPQQKLISDQESIKKKPTILTGVVGLMVIHSVQKRSWKKLVAGKIHRFYPSRVPESFTCLDCIRWLTISWLTFNKYYVENGNVYYDVTPIRRSSTNSTTFGATNGSSTITVTETGHGAVNEVFVTFSSCKFRW